MKEIKIVNRMYQDIPILVNGNTVRLKQKSEITLMVNEITPQMENLASKRFILIKE